jgi:hypothetical protein
MNHDSLNFGAGLLSLLLAFAGYGDVQENESSLQSIWAESAPFVSESMEIESSQPELSNKNAQGVNEMKLNVQAGGRTFSAAFENNDTVNAFMEMIWDAPIMIQMSDYSGFEKVGSLGKSLPADDRQTTTQAGDIVLYNGNQIVIFYGSNAWSYTRLGKIDDLSGWEEALGTGDVTVTFSLAGR